jgi:hypothetical protein
VGSIKVYNPIFFGIKHLSTPLLGGYPFSSVSLLLDLSTTLLVGNPYILSMLEQTVPK